MGFLTLTVMNLIEGEFNYCLAGRQLSEDCDEDLKVLAGDKGMW